jgi:hypothetical protein
VGYDIFPLSRVKFKIKNLKFNSLEWRNIITHGQLKENLYIYTHMIDTLQPGKGMRHFNPLEDYRFVYHWFSGDKTP